MPWIPIEPTRKSNHPSANAAAGCLIGTIKPGRFAPRLNIMVREAPTWWRLGQTVIAEVGTGVDAGKVRVTPAKTGAFKLARAPGNSKLVRLTLPLPAAIPAKGRRAEPTEHDYTEEWLEVTIPAAWLREAAPPPVKLAAAKPPAVPLPDGKQFRLGGAAPSRRAAAR